MPMAASPPLEIDTFPNKHFQYEASETPANHADLSLGQVSFRFDFITVHLESNENIWGH